MLQGRGMESRVGVCLARLRIYITEWLLKISIRMELCKVKCLFTSGLRPLGGEA